MQLFVNRERELRVLEEAYASDRPEPIVVYGRRRLGKTFLLRRFLAGRRSLYLAVNYSERCLALLDLLVFAAKLLQPRPVIVLDEFQRLAGTGLLSKYRASGTTGVAC